MCTWVCILPAALEDLTDTSQLSHIQEFEDDIVSIDGSDPEDFCQTEELTLISNGLPLIPNKLVKCVKEGLFVEMAKLLPSYLDSVDFDSGSQQCRSHKRFPVLQDITEWVQCQGL